MAEHEFARTRSLARCVVASALAVGLSLLHAPGLGAQQSDGAGAASGTTATTAAATRGEGDSSGDQGDRDTEVTAAEASVASLQVDRAAVRAELDRAAAARNRQHDRWALTHLAAEAAKQEVDRTALLAIGAQREVAAAQQRVRDYAVEAFMSPPAAGSLAVLSVSDAEQASRAHDLMKITADDQGRVVDELAVAERGARRAATAATEAAAQAERREAESRAELDALESVVERQRRLSAQIDQRLDSALAEAAALREVDEQAADEMQEAELALARDSRTAASGDTPASGSTSAGGRASAAGSGSSGSQRPSSPRPSTPRPSTPTTTAPRPSSPPPPPSGVVTWSDVTKVGTFWVHTSIASNVRALLNAASAAGFNLTGGGFRDPASQIELRRQHCGGSYYDVYQKPASQCSPPTAIPGRSMHEQGRALDIKSNGALITSRSNPAFQWLAANASRFGFFNLPSEPWHWSTNGT